MVLSLLHFIRQSRGARAPPPQALLLGNGPELGGIGAIGESSPCELMGPSRPLVQQWEVLAREKEEGTLLLGPDPE